jgi:ABC-2 type transport system permease protein
MNRIAIIAKHEYLINLRRTGFIIMTLAVPLLGVIGLLVAAFFGGQAVEFLGDQLGVDPKGVGVVDWSGYFNPILPEYQDRYQLVSDEATGRKALLDEEITLLLVIGEDYLDTGRVTVMNKGSGFGAAVIEDSREARSFFVAHVLRDTVDEMYQRRAANPFVIESVTLSSSGETQGGGPMGIVTTFVIPYLMGLLLIMTVFVSSGYLLQSVAEEKESRVMEVVLSSVTAQELLAGKVIGLGAVGLTQILIWLVSAWGLSGGAAALLALAVPLLVQPMVLILAVVYYLLGFTLYAVLMAAAGSLGSTSRESQQIAGIFSLLAAVPYMVSSFLFTNPNALLARVLSWFPLTGSTMMMLRLPMGEVPLIDIVVSIVLISLTIPFVLWGGAKVFRMGLLMYGKRPSLGQVFRSLREA